LQQIDNNSATIEQAATFGSNSAIAQAAAFDSSSGLQACNSLHMCEGGKVI